MSELDIQIIKLLIDGASLTTLQKETGLYPSDLAAKLSFLKVNGYQIVENFGEKGLEYIISKQINQEYKNKEIKIETNHPWKAIVISDTHIGNQLERMDYLNEIYDYALKRKISYVCHLGDLVEGEIISNPTKTRKLKYETIQEQVNYVTKCYPKRDNITTMYILGNHDIRSIKEHGFDISKPITRRRPDMICLGYISASIKLNNRYILMHHPSGMDEENYDESMYREIEIEPDLVLRGHLHKNKIYHNLKNCLTICVPQLFDLPDKLAGAYEISFDSHLGIQDINELTISPISLYPIVGATMEICMTLPEDKEAGLSQIDKFQKKYGKRK